MTQATFAPNIRLSEFALKLRHNRTLQNLSYQALGGMLGIAPSRLFFFENDKAIPSKKERKIIEKFFQ